MDSECSIMDSSSNEKHSEQQNGIFILPDNLIIRILSELSWKDILNVRRVSRSFSNFIYENYHLLDRRKLRGVSIECDENCEGCPFSVAITYDAVARFMVWVPLHSQFPKKTINFQNDEEMSIFFKMFDMKNLYNLTIPVVDNIDIFDILTRSLQIGTKITFLNVYRVAEKDFKSFRKFVGKFPRISDLSIYHLCFPSTKAKDVQSLLPSSSFRKIKSFSIKECHRTKILSADFFTKLFRNSPKIEKFSIGSGNIEFLKSVFKQYFTVEQSRRLKDRYCYKEIRLELILNGKFKNLRNRFERLCIDITNCSSELENVEEVGYKVRTMEWVDFKYIMDCKYCLEDRHKVKRIVTLQSFDNTCQEMGKPHYYYLSQMTKI
uniref:F-box domain-containing protein n=1 Tax=Strongyloides papillosus TaxID=174720 RepID=A0A0N5BT49_STREA